MLEKCSKKCSKNARKMLEKCSGILLRNFALYARDCSFPVFYLFPLFCLFDSSVDARKRSKTLGRRLEAMLPATCSNPCSNNARTMLETFHNFLVSKSNARNLLENCSVPYKSIARKMLGKFLISSIFRAISELSRAEKQLKKPKISIKTRQISIKTGHSRIVH